MKCVSFWLSFFSFYVFEILKNSPKNRGMKTMLVIGFWLYVGHCNDPSTCSVSEIYEAVCSVLPHLG